MSATRQQFMKGGSVALAVVTAVTLVSGPVGAGQVGGPGGGGPAEPQVAAAFAPTTGPTVPLHDPSWLDDTGTGSTSFLAATPDGRYVAYLTTDATVVGPSSPRRYASVVVRDTATDTVEIDWAWTQANVAVPVVGGVTLSADGRWMTITGILGLDPARPDQVGGGYQAYLIDRWTDTARLVSRNAPGTTGILGSVSNVHVDDSGRYVLFAAGSADVVDPIGGTPVSGSQLYRYDRLSDQVALVSGAPVGVPNGEFDLANAAAMSADGRVVLFGSTSTNLVTSGPGAGQGGTFVRDLVSGTTTPVASPGGTNIGFGAALLSRDGSRVAFTNGHSDLGVTVPGGTAQAYVWRRSNATFTLASPSAVSATTGANGVSQVSSISDDGTVVAFTSTATDLVAGTTDTNGQPDAYASLPGVATGLLSHAAGSPDVAGNGGAERVRLSGDGSVAVYDSSATDLVAGSLPWGAYQTPVVTDLATGSSKWLPSTSSATGQGLVVDTAWVDDDGSLAVFDASGFPLLAHVEPGSLAPAGRFVPLTPQRLLDTRSGEGDERITTGIGLDRPEELHLQVTGRSGVPVRGVGAVVLNVTSVGAVGAGFVSVRPSRLQPQASPFCVTPVMHPCTRPAGSITTSNLNVDRPGRIIANHVTVPVGPGGRVALASTAGGHLVVDVLGYFTPSGATTAGRLVAQTPVRILDTREGLGAPQAPLPPGGSVRLQVAGRGGVPGGGASAVVMNVTVAGSTTAGYLTAWPAGLSRPVASNLNVESAGQVRPNLVTVPLGSTGGVDLLLSAGGHLVADVLGWYTDASAAASTAGRFVPIDPVRFLDTRDPANGGPTKPGAGQTVQRSPSAAGVPVDAAAVITNITATEADRAGYVTAHPAGTTLPVASNLNLEFAGQTIPNQALVRPGPGASVNFFTSGGTHLVADAAGWWTP